MLDGAHMPALNSGKEIYVRADHPPLKHLNSSNAASFVALEARAMHASAEPFKFRNRFAYVRALRPQKFEHQQGIIIFQIKYFETHFFTQVKTLSRIDAQIQSGRLST